MNLWGIFLFWALPRVHSWVHAEWVFPFEPLKAPRITLGKCSPCKTIGFWANWVCYILRECLGWTLLIKNSTHAEWVFPFDTPKALWSLLGKCSPCMPISFLGKWVWLFYVLPFKCDCVVMPLFLYRSISPLVSFFTGTIPSLIQPLPMDMDNTAERIRTMLDGSSPDTQRQ